MATHKYLSNIKGGYFYRFYPNLPKTITKVKDEPTQMDLFSKPEFNPPEDGAHANVRTNLHGAFVKKIYEKNTYTIILLAQGIYNIVDVGSEESECRLLSSEIHIVVTGAQYDYPFEKNKIYSITIDEIIPL